MRLIGITGGIGTGKSTVGRYLQAAGVPVADADDLAHAAIAPDGPAYGPVVAAFGPAILKADGQIDRRILGEQVFADANARSRLNALVHPAVRQMMLQQVAAWQEAGTPVAALIIPLLYENGLEGLFAEVWVASCPHELELARVMTRDGLSRAQAEARINAQLPLSDKVARADRVIDTATDFAGVEAQVRRHLSRAKESP